MGWQTGWTYRKNHIITPASGAGQNYQKRITVHYGVGIDDDENVYLDSKCKSDFGDIRFTDNTGSTLLDYYIEKKVDNDYAICWVEIIEDLSIYDRKIYIYYGNVGATSISNGDNTFIFFDDFEGTLSKWIQLGSPVISTDQAYSGIKSAKLFPLITTTIQRIGGPTCNRAVHVHYYDQVSPLVEYSLFSFDAGEAEESFIGVINDIAQYEYRLAGVDYNSGIDRTVGWHEFISRMSPNLKEFFIDGNLMPITGVENYGVIIMLAGASLNQVNVYWDSVFQTKFVNPEPSHGIWGIEETGTGITTFTAEDIVKLNNSNSLILEDVINSLSQKPINAENILVSLFGSPHVPYTSEDILFALSALRTYMVIKEFITNEGAFPIIGGKHLIDVEGEN